ncbi:hypothetical protein ABZV58_33350 [Nocardia sp. NPDC004654]|uniref:hypothetical protein n=1 Tax=Nocardia sp. NPDC004654 TaxID=3154776 RepID=UPI0033AD163A
MKAIRARFRKSLIASIVTLACGATLTASLTSCTKESRTDGRGYQHSIDPDRIREALEFARFELAPGVTVLGVSFTSGLDDYYDMSMTATREAIDETLRISDFHGEFQTSYARYPDVVDGPRLVDNSPLVRAAWDRSRTPDGNHRTSRTVRVDEREPQRILLHVMVAEI